MESDCGPGGRSSYGLSHRTVSGRYPAVLSALAFALVMFFMVRSSAFRRVVVGQKIPAQFPVLVVSRYSGGRDYRAEIVDARRVKDYCARADHASFLVPLDRYEELNSQLSRSMNLKLIGRDGFDVKPLSEGRQLLTVRKNWGNERRGRVRTGWYVADADGFEPRYYEDGTHLSFAIGQSAMPAMVVGAFVWLFATLLQSRSRSRKRQLPSR